ncbi:hypothetical protein DFH09DRAFT_1479364 [Mycena vulgaris]|nr:hypothetical protein DFH09DRAFT_1479364 [Mycena vulgaris]
MGIILARLFPPKFQPVPDIPNLSDQQLLLKNAKVYLAARSLEKAASAIKRLEDETKKSAIFPHLDLADWRSARTAAETFLAQEPRLDLLFNNGGVLISPPDQLTAQGYDLQSGTNVLGHFYLTELLLPTLTKSCEETKVPVCVINTSSRVHTAEPGNGIEFVSLQGGPERDEWVKRKGNMMVRFRLYGKSKMGNILISNYFAKQHSGVLGSLGAYTQLWSATVATPAQITGQFVIPWGEIGTPDKRSSNMKLEADLIAWIKEEINDF